MITRVAPGGAATAQGTEAEDLKHRLWASLGAVHGLEQTIATLAPTDPQSKPLKGALKRARKVRNALARAYERATLGRRLRPNEVAVGYANGRRGIASSFDAAKKMISQHAIAHTRRAYAQGHRPGGRRASHSRPQQAHSPPSGSSDEPPGDPAADQAAAAGRLAGARAQLEADRVRVAKRLAAAVTAALGLEVTQ